MKVLITNSGVYINDALAPVVAYHLSANAESPGPAKLSLRLVIPQSDITVDLTGVEIEPREGV